MQEFIDAQVQPRVRVRTSHDRALRSLLEGNGYRPVRDTASGRWTVTDARVDEIGRLTARAGVPILELAAEEATL